MRYWMTGALALALAACGSADQEAPGDDAMASEGAAASDDLDASSRAAIEAYDKEVKSSMRGGMAKVLEREFDLSADQATCVVENAGPMPAVSNPETRAAVEACGVDPGKFE